MGCRVIRSGAAALPILGVLCPFVIQAQELSARKVLDLSEAEQVEFVRTTMDQGFSEDRADSMTMLIINRSQLVLPILEARIEEALKSATADKRFIDVASEMVAYAGDQQALSEIGKLMSLNEKRFAPLVARALQNALNWRNPFTLAYWALDSGDIAVGLRTMEWIESTVASQRMQRVWAEAMLDRYGSVPAGSDWEKDPIAVRLKPDAASGLKDRILSLTSQIQRSRNQRQ